MPLRVRRGFTLLEMMVVVTISLSMVLLLVPIFQVVTRTVTTVERKLFLYESARNVLDLLEYEVKMAAHNERGEHFSLKSWSEQDLDPKTRDEDDDSSTPDTKPYFYSLRTGDSIAYTRLQGGGFRFAANLLQPGSMAHPMCCPEVSLSSPEAWRATIRSTLIYPHIYNEFGSYVTENVGTEYDYLTRLDQRANPALTELSLVAYTFTGQHEGGGSDVVTMDPIPLHTAPGFEIKLTEGDDSSGVNRSREDPRRLVRHMMHKEHARTKVRRAGGINVMDFDVSWWDDVAKTFVDPPDRTAVYFWPAPKAVRLRICVTEPERRGQIVLSRVVQLICGTGEGQVAFANDATWLDADPNPFNRTKAFGANVEPGILVHP